MSLILDALNRSRQDVGEVPGLDSQHQLADNNPGGGSRWWALALVVALAVIALLLYERGSESEPLVQPPSPAVVPELPQPVVVEQPASRVTTEPAPAEEPAPPVVSEPARDIPDADVAALYATESDTREAAAPAEAVPDKADKPVTPAPAAKEAVSEQPVDIEAMLSQARNELENAQLEEHPAPFLTSLSQQSKDRIPTIIYERHDYSGNAGQSAVVLNGKTLREGGRTGSGLRVDEILADSVVLTYQGTQFRLRALNSWVNL